MDTVNRTVQHTFFFLISKENFIYKETPKKRFKVYKPIHPPPKRPKKKKETKIQLAQKTALIGSQELSSTLENIVS